MDKVEELKLQGNVHFQRSEINDAVASYTAALEILREIPIIKSTATDSVEPTILSNRAACYLKLAEEKEKDGDLLRKAIQDCNSAFSLVSSSSSLSAKILYRRARAKFLLGELNPAAQDLLTVLSIDKTNVAASKLLQSIRQTHALQQTENTPLARLLKDIQQKETGGEHLQDHLKMMFAMLSQDTSSLALEFGRLGGLDILWKIALPNEQPIAKADTSTKLRVLALQILSCVCSVKAFAIKYAIPPHFYQMDLVNLIVESCSQEKSSSVAVSGIALFLRLVLALDDDKESTNAIDNKGVCQTCIAALSCREKEIQKAAFALLSTWSSADKEIAANAILSSISDVVHKTNKKLSKMDLNRLSPREFAEHKKKEYEDITRSKERSKSNSQLFCKEGGLHALLSCVLSADDGRQIREVCVVIGRLLSQVETEENIKSIIEKNVSTSSCGPIIEVLSDEENDVPSKSASDLKTSGTNDRLLFAGLIAISLFYANNDVGLWVLDQHISVENLVNLIESGCFKEMFIASEIVASCAVSDKGRNFLQPLLESGTLDFLLESDNVEVSSGAASAVAKLGMSSKVVSKDEGEMVGMLQLAVDLLYDNHLGSEDKTSIERGVEILSFLTSATIIKDEIAHGFKSSNRLQQTAPALERLVELAFLPGAPESRYAYGLAVVFSLMSVSVESLRKEAFEGKDITLEEYNQLQSLAKTQEEKQQSQKEEDKDSEVSVKARIRKMAAANVPRAIVKLLDGDASESTQEQLVVAMCRMAVEETARGIMIQQGCLSSCLKMDRDMGNGSELQKKIVRFCRHCIAKLLITTNPLVLTNAQLLGCIKPLLLLLHDNDSTDLQRFEALLSLTNLASTGEATKNKIVSEKGLSILNYAMFSEHDMVRRAATEAMSNLFPHRDFVSFLEAPEHLKLWVAFACDFEDNFECARAAAGCLAMASEVVEISVTLSALPKFREMVLLLLQCGNFELMHRILVLILNMMAHGGKPREAIEATGAIAFCHGYLSSFNENNMELSPSEKAAMANTLKLAKDILSLR